MNILDIAMAVGGFLGAPALVSSALAWWMSHRLGRFEARAETRRDENVLLLRGLLTVGGLANETARAVRDGHANGSVTTAMEDYERYKEDLTGYLFNQNAKINH